MTTGVKKWTSQGVQVSKYERVLIPDGEYEMTLDSSDSRIGKAAKPGSAPYVTTMIKVEGTEEMNPQGKTMRVLTAFYLGLKPGKDGKLNVERSGGLANFAHGMGQETPDFSLIEIDDGDGGTYEALSATEVKDWIQSLDGATFKGIVKTEPARDGYQAKNKVDYFVEAEASVEEEEQAPAPVTRLPARKPAPVQAKKAAGSKKR